MTNEIQQHVKGFTKAQNQALTAGILEGAYIQEILRQLLPGSDGTVGDALNCVCEHLHPGSNRTPAQICALEDSLGRIGLSIARAVPGYILGQNEARIYVSPRLVNVAYPELAFKPRPFAFTATLSSDELPALDGPPSGFGCKEDWHENNEFERTEIEESEVDEFVERFRQVLMNQALPRTQVTVAQALENLCAGLNAADESSLKRCDALHMKLENIGLRFYRYSESFDYTGLPGKGFLRLENSRQFVRFYPALDWMIPFFYPGWIAMLPQARNI